MGIIRPAKLLGLALAAAVLAGSGCVRRTLEITSEPSGAQVVVNGHPAGFTPVKLDFRYHGTYLIELRKSGWAPVRAGGAVPPKFYELAGADLVAEVLWPGEVVDERRIHYRLEPAPPVNRDELLAASRRAAAEAERLVPVLVPAPPPNPDAKDHSIIPGNGHPKPEAKPAPDPSRTPPAADPPGKPPKTRTIPPPEDVPEIERGR
ncbi:MAG TPA: PEGA domain-containing protein [Planctomycetota bacterium]|nr:PEGA domain-containing protein [Planctomycetota bacterium]